MGCSGLLSIWCCLGGKERPAGGCGIVEDLRGYLWSSWTQLGTALGGERPVKEITALHQSPAPEQGSMQRPARSPRLANRLWKVPEHFKVLHKTVSLCVYISLERKLEAPVTCPKGLGNESESFLSTDVTEKAVCSQ